MAKRFTSTEIWTEDWFLEMPTEYKLFWFYTLSNCDHAGIYKVNLRSFCGLNEVKIKIDDAIAFFNKGKQRIRVISDTIWLIEDFFVYQYGTTWNINNRVHLSIADVYKRHKIEMSSIRGLLDLNDTVKDKDKDKDKDKVIIQVSSEKIKGISFDEKFENVIFNDGSTQKLGVQQKEMAEMGQIKPITIIKGSIY